MREIDLLAGQVPEGMRLDRRQDDVVPGQGEWLFERDGGRSVMSQMRGDLILAPKAAWRWQFVLESRRAWLARRDVAYVFAVAPDAYVVMADKLPDGVVTSPRRPVTQVMRHIDKAESSAVLVYPLDELEAARKEHATFSSHDSRWNSNGAFVAYQRIIDEIAKAVDVRRLERDQIGFAWCMTDGDLGHRLASPVRRKTLLGRPHPRSARLLFDNRVEGTGRMLITQCDKAPATSCLFLGDWSAYRMLTFVSESFERMVFAHTDTLDHELVETERPDVVLTLSDESAMLTVPADVEAPSARELAVRKLAAGREPMPDLAPLWGQQAAEAATPSADLVS